MSTAPSVLLLPAALVDPGWLGPGVLARASAAPAWTRVARRSSTVGTRGPQGGPTDDPGHERWWRERLALPDGVALAAAAAHADGVPDADWRLDVVHLHVGRDHLVMTDPGALPALAADDARALAEAVAPLFADDGLVLAAPTPSRWYLRETDAARPLRLRTRSLAGALGRNIDAWMPTGEDARRWRRLVNEVQMTWHAHPVNARRAEASLPPLNSVWIDGRVPRAPTGDARLAAAARLATQAVAGGFDLHDGDGPVRVDESLLRAQLDGDPQRWLAAWEALDAGTFAAIAEAAGPWRDGARIVLCGDAGWRELAVPARPDWRFWRRADPAAVLAEPGASADAPRREPVR